MTDAVTLEEANRQLRAFQAALHAISAAVERNACATRDLFQRIADGRETLTRTQASELARHYEELRRVTRGKLDGLAVLGLADPGGMERVM